MLLLTGGAGTGRGEQIAILILSSVLVDGDLIQSDQILIFFQADRGQS
jgi:hypothetical protein